ITGLRASGSFEIRSLEKDLLAGGITYKKIDLIKTIVSKTNYLTEWRCMRIHDLDPTRRVGFKSRGSLRSLLARLR
ncbi:MAG: hypothetical protein ACE5J9_07960, partial [Methanosarcinales archaeon]